jgi:hypothetical protein
MSRMTSSDSFGLAFDFLGALFSASPPPAEDGAEAFFFIALLFFHPNLCIAGQSGGGHLCPASHQLFLGLWEFTFIEDHSNSVRLLTLDYLTAFIPG